jgi:hypothetical protein
MQASASIHILNYTCVHVHETNLQVNFIFFFDEHCLSISKTIRLWHSLCFIDSGCQATFDKNYIGKKDFFF